MRRLEPNRKVLVFTAFADTATYLYESLIEWAHKDLGIQMALVCGGGDTRTTFGNSAYEGILRLEPQIHEGFRPGVSGSSICAAVCCPIGDARNWSAVC